MHLFRRITGSLPEGFPARDRRSAGPRRARIECEMLEGRALMSVPGVSLVYGNIQIMATKASGNIAQVSIAADHNVQVSLNGQSEEFSPSQVYNVTYLGGINGGDTFTNTTNLVELAYGRGGGNNFSGGTSYNFVFLYGNTNTYTSNGFSDVWENGGQSDNIITAPAAAGPSGLQIYR